MLGHGPVMQAGPYEGYTFEDVLEQDPLAVLEYMDKYGYDDPEMRARAKAALEMAEEEYDLSFIGFDPIPNHRGVDYDEDETPF